MWVLVCCCLLFSNAMSAACWCRYLLLADARIGAVGLLQVLAWLQHHLMVSAKECSEETRGNPQKDFLKIALKRAGYDIHKLGLKTAVWESCCDWLETGIGCAGGDPSPLGTNVQCCFIFIKAFHQTRFDTRSFYSGVFGKEKVRHELRFVPCWTMVVICPLSSMWARWPFWTWTRYNMESGTYVCS